MTHVRTRVSLVAAVTAAAVLGGSAASTAARTTMAPFCKGSQLAGSFKAVRGSAGAGNIVYRLTLTNVSSATCALTGLPSGQLLGKSGKKLPTHIRAAFPQGLTAILVTLPHGEASRATARFSPDVPGVGEQTTGQCEATSYSLRVTQRAGGATTVKITPPTPVCEHGQLTFSAYGK